MIHEQFDLAHWIEMFPLPYLRQEARRYMEGQLRRGRLQQYFSHVMSAEQYIQQSLDWFILAMSPSPSCAEMITSPFTIAAIEQLRAEQLPRLPDAPRIPTDIFVFARGEPAQRAVTKVGGLPYWPARHAWPCAPSGAPLTFIAQINFADSRDITGELPGDILLIFGAGEEDIFTDGLHFEWLRLSGDNLIDRAAVPKTDWRIMPCHGQIYRTFDVYWERPEVDWDGDDPVEDHLRILNATKIGGIPFPIQFEPPMIAPWGRYFASLTETRPDRAWPYPYVNVPEPLGHTLGPEEHAFMFHDCGVMHLFVEDDGRVHADVQGS